MFSLVYVSFAAHDLNDEALKDILKVARETNQQMEITGMLLYRDGFFIQVLEGDEDKVKALFARIAADPRHRNVLTVHTGRVESRRFPDWTMGFNKLSDSDLDQIPGFTDFLSRPDDGARFTQNSDRVLALLDSFKNRSYY
ncbi:MAG: BLUF domain-containing protein [Anaerolineae bacterium]|nr:BLUF domain-containing protein [Anaerolineae bacterium]NUQ06166.1 BLUF domain-containing protein [Anaerolineae bacterium]